MNLLRFPIQPKNEPTEADDAKLLDFGNEVYRANRQRYQAITAWLDGACEYVGLVKPESIYLNEWDEGLAYWIETLTCVRNQFDLRCEIPKAEIKRYCCNVWNVQYEG